MYRAKIERHSIGPNDVEAVSFIIEFPRIVLAEAVTHRCNYDSWEEGFFTCERTTTRDISKNSASSRAIPHNRMIEKIERDPFMPFWSIAEKGMQGSISTDEEVIGNANLDWISARNAMLYSAERLNALGIHKQDSNRLLEPWGWVTQIVTSSRWSNFFALRCHKAAHPAIRHIARMMYLLYRKSTPTRLWWDQWHLPFVPLEEQMKFKFDPDFSVTDEPLVDLPPLLRASVARCAWISYENAEKAGTQEAMDKTFSRLFSEIPVHASCAEHQLSPLGVNHRYYAGWRSNISGWLQARKLIRNEEVKEFEPTEEEIKEWGIDEENMWPEPKS